MVVWEVWYLAHPGGAKSRVIAGRRPQCRRNVLSELANSCSQLVGETPSYDTNGGVQSTGRLGVL